MTTDQPQPASDDTPEAPPADPGMIVVRRYTRADLVARLADLGGQPVPDLTHQDVTGIAVAQVHLTNLALQAGATWRQIAAVFSQPNLAVAKRNHRRLEAELRRRLTLVQNAN